MPNHIPTDLGPAGRALFASVVERFDVSAEEGAVLLSAAKTADIIDALQEAVDRDGVVLPNGRTHPALVELRHQRITLSRLIASLRIPDEPADDENGPAPQRPQRRGGARGAYNVGGSR